MHIFRNDVKGYVLTRYQGSEWQPLVTNQWALPMGQQICQVLLGSDSAQVKRLEAINVHELSGLLEKQGGTHMLRGVVVKLDANEVESITSSSNIKMLGLPGQISKVSLNLGQRLSSNGNHLNSNSENDLMVGFVQCAK